MITQGIKMADRRLDATSANLIAVYDKVIQILKGEIPLPEVVELFITNYCRFACPFCRCSKYHGDKSQFIYFEILVKLLDELAENRIMTLELGGGGEPLEHPQIFDLLHCFQERSFRVGLITNGYKLTERPDLVGPLLACADWIRFSVDATSDDVDQIVHGRNDVSYLALRKMIVEMVQEISVKSGVDRRPKIGIKLIIQRPNEHQVLKAIDEALEIGVNYLQFKWLEEHKWSVKPERRLPLIDALQSRIASQSPESLIVDVLPGYGGFKIQERCVMSVLHPLVDWDGTIYMCAFFHHRKKAHSIGTLRESKFFDCWGSDHHREQIRNVNPTQCTPNCPLLRYNPVIKFIRDEAFRFRYI
jgi:radical SAM protein with 4Fe4S-binding SPASM domain